jgi:hypothetical protein
LPVGGYLQRASINNFFFFSVGKARPYQHGDAYYDEYNSDWPIHGFICL